MSTSFRRSVNASEDEDEDEDDDRMSRNATIVVEPTRLTVSQ